MNNDSLGCFNAPLQMDILFWAEMCENIQNIPFWHHLAPVPILVDGPCNSQSIVPRLCVPFLCFSKSPLLISKGGGNEEGT